MKNATYKSMSPSWRTRSLQDNCSSGGSGGGSKSNIISSFRQRKSKTRANDELLAKATKAR